jgi:hypothetical protein
MDEYEVCEERRGQGTWRYGERRECGQGLGEKEGEDRTTNEKQRRDLEARIEKRCSEEKRRGRSELWWKRELNGDWKHGGR